MIWVENTNVFQDVISRKRNPTSGKQPGGEPEAKRCSGKLGDCQSINSIIAVDIWNCPLLKLLIATLVGPDLPRPLLTRQFGFQAKDLL